MRKRLLLSSLLIALAAIVVLGAPLTFLAIQHVHDEARDRIERQAEAAAAVTGSGRGAVPVARLRAIAGPDRAIVVTARDGHRTVVGRVPTGDVVRVAATTGANRVMVIAPAGALDAGRGRVLTVIGLSALVSLGAALALGWWLSRRFARPLESLAHVSRRLGAGDFSVRAGRHGLAEVDAVAAALDRSAERLGDLVARERAFSGNVAHQLRTPLTALRLRLEELADSADEATRDEAVAALAQADRLERTVEDLLALARAGGAGRAEAVDVAAVVRARARAWAPEYHRARRALRVAAPDRAVIRTVRGAVEQALDVLLENALRHGAGTVRLEVRRLDRHAALAVSDEGSGIATDAEAAIFERGTSPEGGTGLGLPLARALVDAAGGRLRLTAARPPRFEILLPVGGGDRPERAEAATETG